MNDRVSPSVRACSVVMLWTEFFPPLLGFTCQLGCVALAEQRTSYLSGPMLECGGLCHCKMSSASMVWTCDRLTGGLGLTVERKRNISINREANDTTGGCRLIPNHIFHPVDRSNNQTQTARIRGSFFGLQLIVYICGRLTSPQQRLWICVLLYTIYKMLKIYEGGISSHCF